MPLPAIATEGRREPTSARSRIVQAGVLLALLVGAPLAGVALEGGAPGAYLTIPPRPAEVAYPGFSSPVFVILAVLFVAVLAPLLGWLLVKSAPEAPPPAAAFPGFGWLGVAILAVAWPLAWGLLPVSEAVRAHSFTPVWLGYILIVQGLVYRRHGACLLSVAPLRFVALFPASAAFWWTFEFLNQFVGNWVYHGTASMGAVTYLLTATLPFTTVLPAILSTRDLLATWPALYAPFDGVWRAPALPRTAAAALVVAATGLLAALPVWPALLFAALWIAPLVLLTGIQALAGDRHVLSPPAEGRLSPLWLAALAGLVCGLFWEFWNWGSLARWEYNIPYVEGVYLFEMPILGYAGYLPFGLICIAAARLVTGLDIVPFAGVGPRRE